MQIKFFKKEKNFKKAKESLWSHLNFFWKLAVYLMLIATAAFFFFGYYLFSLINKEIVLETSGEDSQVETVKQDRIDRILEYFSVRKQRTDEILNSPAPFIDPSL